MRGQRDALITDPGTLHSMLICNRCSTSIPDGARFCPACGDPVTAGDLARNQVVPRNESVQLICPHCDRRSLYTMAADGVGRLTCAECGNVFDTNVVRVRSKRSTGQKKLNNRSFSVRVETLDGRDEVVEFTRKPNEDFELRSRDLAAFSSIEGQLIVVQNLTVGRHIKLVTIKQPPQGCMGAVLLWLGVFSAAGSLVF